MSEFGGYYVKYNKMDTEWWTFHVMEAKNTDLVEVSGKEADWEGKEREMERDCGKWLQGRVGWKMNLCIPQHSMHITYEWQNVIVYLNKQATTLGFQMFSIQRDKFLWQWMYQLLDLIITCYKI